MATADPVIIEYSPKYYGRPNPVRGGIIRLPSNYRDDPSRRVPPGEATTPPAPVDVVVAPPVAAGFQFTTTQLLIAAAVAYFLFAKK